MQWRGSNDKVIGEKKNKKNEMRIRILIRLKCDNMEEKN